eukprot:g6768.t2
MRCVPDLFKHHLPDVARTLVTAFQQHQHSTYLYSAEVLARTYAKDPENVPVLTELFNQLSGIGLQSLVHSEDKLEEIRELAEARESIPAILQPWAFTMARQLYESELQEARSSLAKLQAELQEVPSYALPKKKHGRRDLGEFAVWYANRPPPESIDMLHSYDFVAHHLVASRL